MPTGGVQRPDVYGKHTKRVNRPFKTEYGNFMLSDRSLLQRRVTASRAKHLYVGSSIPLICRSPVSQVRKAVFSLRSYLSSAPLPLTPHALSADAYRARGWVGCCLVSDLFCGVGCGI